MNKIILSCDVLVVGGGISGICAAVSASRCAATTILIEQNNYPGGLALDCQHQHICGLYPKNSGIAAEIILGLKKLNPNNRFIRLGKLSVFYFQPKDLKTILNKLIRKEKNLKVFYNSRAIGVKSQKGRITCVKVNTGRPNLNRKLHLIPKTVIDATGEGAIIKLSGAKHQVTPLKSRQLAGFTFEVTDLKDNSGILTVKVPYFLALAVKQKKLPLYFKFTNFTYGQTKKSGTLKLNLPAYYACQKKQNTKKHADLALTYLRKTLPEFKNSRIRRISANIHQRQSLRLSGEHTLTEQEVLTAGKFPDSLAKGYWPIEFWDPKNGQKIKYLKTGQFYEIPAGCIKSKNIKNLLAIGKCISAAPRAQASSRVMGTCIYLGEAAGKAAKR